MKKSILFSLAAVSSLVATAQITDNVAVLPEVMIQIISRNGEYAAGQNIFGSQILAYSTSNFEETVYKDIYPGSGNFVSDNGIIVGEDIASSTAVIMRYGNANIYDNLIRYGVGNLISITPDGTRAVGFMANTTSSTYAVPCYVDINEDGIPGDPVPLPYPKNDLLNDVPSVVNAFAISDDGKTIAGTVFDGFGLYYYPIVYKMQDNGEWKYFLPSEPMFNPDGLPLPQFPEYQENESDDEYYQRLDQYYIDMKNVTDGSNFAANMLVMNSQGTLLATSLTVNKSEFMSDQIDGFKLCVFNLEDQSHTVYDFQYDYILPHQYLADGTLLCREPNAYADFILLPGEQSLVPFEEFLSTVNPEWLTWMENNLRKTNVYSKNGIEEFIMAGPVSFSKDLTVMSGYSVDDNGSFSYILKNRDAGIESFTADITPESGIKVFDLTGCKVMDTTNPSQLDSLRKGIYIVNGKKIIIK